MKKTTLKLIAIVAISVLGIAAISTVNYELKKNTAEVEMEEGVYVFYRSKPISEYEYLGTYEIQFISSNKPDAAFSKLIRKTKDKYPNADAIIIDNSLYKCDAIKFK